MINDLNAQVLPQFHTSPRRRYLFEVEANPGDDSVLFVHGMGFLTGGQPDGWSVERFERLLPYRTQFGAVESDIRERHVVVTSAGAYNQSDEFALHLPLSTSELYTATFNGVVTEFAAKHHLRVIVRVYSTYNSVHPEEDDEGSDFGSVDKRYFGATGDNVVVMHFFTAECMKRDGPMGYWGGVLRALQLRWGAFYSPFQRHDMEQPRLYDKREVDAFLAQFAQMPEVNLGNPDYVTAHNMYATRRVTLLRHHFEEIVPDAAKATDDEKSTEGVEPEYREVLTVRTFFLEDVYEQGRRHRGEATDRE